MSVLPASNYDSSAPPPHPQHTLTHTHPYTSNNWKWAHILLLCSFCHWHYNINVFKLWPGGKVCFRRNRPSLAGPLQKDHLVLWTLTAFLVEKGRTLLCWTLWTCVRACVRAHLCVSMSGHLPWCLFNLHSFKLPSLSLITKLRFQGESTENDQIVNIYSQTGLCVFLCQML